MKTRDTHGQPVSLEPIAVDIAVDLGWGGFWPDTFVADGEVWTQEAPVLVGDHIGGYRYVAQDGRCRLVMERP